MAHGSATQLISLAVLFYAPHFHYHSLMVSHYMIISYCHNKEVNFKNKYVHSGNTLANTMHDRGSSTVYNYCSPICVNPSTVGIHYTVCMPISTYIYPSALQNQNSILYRCGLCVSKNIILNYGTSRWMVYSCNSSKKMTTVLWDVVAYALVNLY